MLSSPGSMQSAFDESEEHSLLIRRHLAVLALRLGVSTLVAMQPKRSAAAARTAPNFVVIVVDDLDSGSASFMSAVNRLLTQQGTTVSRFLATTPLCCPS